MHIKKILWPTDFSEPSYEALEVAKEMAAMYKAKLHMAHIITPLPPFAPPPKGRPSFNVSAYIDNLRISAEKSLQEVVGKKIGNGLETEPIILQGDAADEIARFSGKNNIDLIVIASHGATRRKPFLVGSVTEKLVRISTVPLQIIPKSKS